MSLKRQADILQAVRETGSASITDLAVRLNVSTETIRRNIKPLIDQGSVLRFHGGIMHPEQTEDPPFLRRMQLNRIGKRQVAALVLDRVRDGDSLILDNGTTTTYVAEALAARSRLVVITNSAQIACRLANHNNNRVFMTGGELGGDDAAAFGPSSIEFVKQFEVRYALLSVAGINARGELVDFHLFEAEFSRAAMAQAEETWVIADQSKFGREAPVKVCELGKVQQIITDAPPPEDFAMRCASMGVRIVTG
jgi:DeoR family transcriptional regulator, glycerol-3-phosphate regulon repressor